YRSWNYCVQYRETDFNFVSRLMEHEGIGYFFRHTEGHHTLVLTDSVGSHEKSPGAETLPFIDPDRVARPDIQHVTSWEFGRQIEPGAYVHEDHHFELPDNRLTAKKTVSRKSKKSTAEVYDYPGYYAHSWTEVATDVGEAQPRGDDWA